MYSHCGTNNSVHRGHLRTLDARVETRCPGVVSVSCLTSRSRHFWYYFIVLVKSYLYMYHAKKSLPVYLYIDLLFQIIASLRGPSALDNFSQFE